MKNLDILLVDDDPLIKFYIQKTLVRKNIANKVYTVNNGQEALELLDGKAAGMDRVLIFLDIEMPVLNGWGFLNELQKKDYQSKANIVVVSTSTELGAKRTSDQYPQVMGYLEKPIPPETLLDIIDLFKSNIIERLKIKIVEK